MVTTALLNKLRSSFNWFLLRIAGLVSRTGLTPNAVTLLSLLVALAGYLATVETRTGLFLAVAIALSGFMDAIDGALARLLGRASKFGAFLDSLVDRVCEVLYSASFLELGVDPRLVLAYLSSSMLVSYIRARGETLGLQVSGVGLMERAERLISLMIVALLIDISHVTAVSLLGIITVLVVFTAVHRFMYVWENIRRV